jgi:hypothetical protein
MKYICNKCGNVIQDHDVTIHYLKDSNGLDIVVICQLCLDDYLEKIMIDDGRKVEDAERKKMKRKW